ncbi:MAG: glycosyltransferase family 39 protein [bacterium]
MRNGFVLALLVLIVASSFFIRVYRLGENPPALFIDEASVGYNAYSILKTGRNEFGKFLPIFARAFGINFHNPVYLYSTVASVKFFGLNEFAVRLPAAIFGAAAVLFTFLLAIELWKNARIALIAAFLLAVSPWNFHLSRFAIEPTSLSCILTAGIYFLIRSLRQTWCSFPAAVLLALSFYSYAPAFSFIPLFIIIFVILFRTTLKLNWKYYLTAALVLLILVIPLAFPSVRGETQDEYLMEQLITHPRYHQFSVELLEESGFPWAWVKYIERRPTLLAVAVFARNYFSCFSYRFLFAAGDTSTSRQHVSGFGVLHRAEAIFVIAGILICLLHGGVFNMLLLMWLLIFPIGPSLTAQWTPQITRLVCALPAFQLLGALGISSVLSTLFQIKNGRSEMVDDRWETIDVKYKMIFFVSHLTSHILHLTSYISHLTSNIFRLTSTIVISAFLIFLCFNIATYFSAFFKHYPSYAANAWGYGIREAIKDAEAVKDDYDLIIVDEKIPFVYIYVLFYLPFEPERLLKEEPLRFHGPYRIGTLGKYLIAQVRPCPEPMRCLYITHTPPPPFARPVRLYPYPGAVSEIALSSNQKRK